MLAKVSIYLRLAAALFNQALTLWCAFLTVCLQFVVKKMVKTKKWWQFPTVEVENGCVIFGTTLPMLRLVNYDLQHSFIVAQDMSTLA